MLSLRCHFSLSFHITLFHALLHFIHWYIFIIYSDFALHWYYIFLPIFISIAMPSLPFRYFFDYRLASLLHYARHFAFRRHFDSLPLGLYCHFSIVLPYDYFFFFHFFIFFIILFSWYINIFRCFLVFIDISLLLFDIRFCDYFFISPFCCLLPPFILVAISLHIDAPVWFHFGLYFAAIDYLLLFYFALFIISPTAITADCRRLFIYTLFSSAFH